MAIKWTRKTKAFDYAPYVSECGRFIVGDLSDCCRREEFKRLELVQEYNELRKHNWDNDETHKSFLSFCKENKIRPDNANWILIDNGEFRGIFKTAKSAKENAEELL